MKQTRLLKTLLAAVCLLVGTSSAWAETETFGASKATTKDTEINGTAVSIASTSNPGGTGPNAVFNNKTDNGLKLRTNVPITINVKEGYRVTGVTVYAYQNNTSTASIECDTYSIDGGDAVECTPSITIPLNVNDASKQTIATINTGTIVAKSSITFNFTNNVGTESGTNQKQIYTYIEVEYESLTKTVVSIPCTGTAATIENGGSVTGSPGSMVISQPSGNSFKITSNYMSVGTGTGTVAIAEADRPGYAHKAEGKNNDIFQISFSMAFGNTADKVYSGFEILDENDNIIATLMSSKWSGINSSANTFGLVLEEDVYKQSGNNTSWSQKTDFTLIFNYQTGKITCKTQLNTSGKTIDMASGKPVVAKFILRSNNSRGDDTRQPFFSNLVMTNTEGDYEADKALYTVNWKKGDEIIKTDDTRMGEVDADIVLSESDDDPFWVSSKKYFYVSSDAEGKTVAADGSTVVTITVRDAENWNYTVNAKKGSTFLKTVKEGTVIEGESVTVAYPQQVLVDNKLYEIAQRSTNPRFKVTLTPNADNYTEELGYNSAVVDNVIYYTEAEDIGTSSGTNDSYASLNKMGYTANNTTYIEVTTLQAGKYKIYARGVNGNAATRTCNFKIGDGDPVWSFSITNGIDITGNSEEFTVPAASQLYFACDGSSASGCDWFYIVKTGEIKAIGTYGYATFSSTYAIDLDNIENAKAYIVTGKNGSSITLQEVTGKVAANTGLILKSNNGGAADVTIPVTTDEGTYYDLHSNTINYLFGIDHDYDLSTPDEGTHYVLTVQDEKVVFAPIGSTTAAVKAGQAALWLPASAGAKALTLSFADDITGINEVGTIEPKAGKIYYNLQGQRVSEPKEGIYVVEGKKVLVNKMSH